MLSDVDIVKELGKNILIYPFDEKNLKGASFNLTASKFAWSISTKETIILGDKIVIPPHDTGIIYTSEIVSITKNISGTFHSRVNDVSSGCGHIGTTLNPGWFGRLLIAITNHTDTPITIDVGDPFVTLIFYYLKHKSTNLQDDNTSNRRDIITKKGITLNNDEAKALNEMDVQNVQQLINKIKEESVYEKIKKVKKIKQSKLFLGSIILLITLIFVRIFLDNKIPYEFIKELLTIASTILLTYFFGIILKNKE